MELYERLIKLTEIFTDNSQAKFARSIGLFQQTFHGYLNPDGQQKIRKVVLDAILTTYPEVNRDWLYFGEGAMFTCNNVPEAPTSPHDCQRRITELEAELKEERALNRRLTERLLEMGKN
ncbi:hypothetical protein [Desulfovibrio sp.]|uniref:hypothetical protein n=1 Tax=Desulfovibrio sp. TaxID=885 RepID=UPI00307A7235